MSIMHWSNCLSPQWCNLPFPIFQNAVTEAEQATQAPIKMVGHCAVNAIFSSVQGLGDHERLDGGTEPLTNISLIVGETGERKSTVDACFFKEISKFRDEESKSNAHVDIEHGVRMKDWKIEEKILEKRLRTSILEGRSDRGQLIDALKKHALRRPKPACKITFMYQDTSLTSLKLGLASFPSACVHSTEGMSILKGALFAEQGLLCSLYSGETYLYDRMDKSISLKDKRLCVSAHSQPKRTFDFLVNMGEEFRDSGLASRITVCLLNSTQGYRKYDAVEIPSSARDRFSARVRYLLKTSKRAAKRADFQRRRVRFSPNAAREHLAYTNWVEHQMLPGGKFQHARDYANRLAQKVGRLSAALHLFEDFEGDISMDTLMAAQSFYNEEAADFQYLFNYLPSEQCRADQLLQWLQNRPPLYGEPGVKKSYIEQRCIIGLRRKAALDPLLGLLEQQGKVHLQTRNKTTYVCLGPKPMYVVLQQNQMQQYWPAR